MTHYCGGEKVRPGLYLNSGHLSFKSMYDEGRLPGTREDRYCRVPAVLLLVAGPLVGGLYVVFLPLIGFGMVAWLLLSKAVGVAADLTGSIARVLEPAWQPARAFLSRRQATKKTSGRKDKWAEEVRKELDDENGRSA